MVGSTFRAHLRLQRIHAGHRRAYYTSIQSTSEHALPQHPRAGQRIRNPRGERAARAQAGQGRNADPTSLHVANVRLVAAGAFQPRWSPDGRRLVYTQKAKSGTDAWQLWSSDQRGLTKMMVATKGFSGAWSPDGRKIA